MHWVRNSERAGASSVSRSRRYGEFIKSECDMVAVSGGSLGGRHRCGRVVVYAALASCGSSAVAADAGQYRGSAGEAKRRPPERIVLKPS